MLPASIGISLVLLSLVPGWFYLRLRERLAPPSAATGISELLEVLAVGLATTGTSVAIFIFLPPSWLPVFLDVGAWAAQGNGYLLQHIQQAAASSIGVLLLALFIAFLLYLPLRLSRPAEFRAQGNVWVHALGERPKGKLPWVLLQLKDGKQVEGILHSYSLSDSSLEEKDVALQKPIQVTLNPGEHAKPLGLDRVIVPGTEISYITVTHVADGRMKEKKRRNARPISNTANEVAITVDEVPPRKG